MSRAALAAIVAVLRWRAWWPQWPWAGGRTPATAARIAGSSGGGKLAWEGRPEVVTPKTLPRDRILTADLRNDTLKEVDLRADQDVKLLDRTGRQVVHTTIFIEGFGRDIYPPRYRRKIPLQDQLRLGLRAKIKPGESVPITAPWRVRSGGGDVVRLQTPAGVLGAPSPDRHNRGVSAGSPTTTPFAERMAAREERELRPPPPGVSRPAGASPSPTPTTARRSSATATGSCTQGVPAAQAQDPGVHLARGRPLPHTPDPHARGLRHRPQRGPRAGP